MRRPTIPVLAVLAVLAALGPGTATASARPAPALAAGPATPAPVSGPASAPSAAPVTEPSAVGTSSPVPLLAFYYVWFDVTSWRRAKTDYPQLGRYTSDDPAVMRRHIEWAKAAGINGFIVSWKDTPTNNRRLSLLMEVARQQKFQLAMIYQGLDFDRRPLPVERVAADFAYFRSTYALDPVFLRLGGKPLTVWSGTWAYSREDVARVTGPVRDSMLVLNTEKNLAGYERIADVTDGDAYYWSSVNPAIYTDYGEKLKELSRAVHRRGKYWVAPFAPGFDARLVGGSRAVPREGGATLRTEYAAAVASSPDALGLISWNEFSENSHVEPSLKEGDTALKVLADLRRSQLPPPPAAVDSSEPQAGTSGGPVRITPSLIALLGFFVLFVGGVAFLRPVVARRDGVALGGVDGLRPPALPASRIVIDAMAVPALATLKTSADSVNGSPTTLLTAPTSVNGHRAGWAIALDDPPHGNLPGDVPAAPTDGSGPPVPPPDPGEH